MPNAGSSDNSGYRDLFDRLSIIARSVASVFGKTCEVVVHDLRQPERSVVEIVNGHISGRKIGSPLVEGPIDDIGMEEIVAGGPPDGTTGAYRSRTEEGRQLKSSTAIFYDDDGEPLACLCINWVLTFIERIAEFIDLVNADLPDDQGASAREAATNPQDVARRIVDQVISEYGKPTYLLQRQDRMEVVGTVWKRGIFLIKGSVGTVAEALGISENTVYGYLSEIKKAATSAE
ncbi:MAG: PAS domain-containing protein [Bacillota bacterium]